jgi:hypothetical protein
MLINRGDWDEYESGYATHAAGDPFPFRGTWWQREGWNHGAAKWAKIALVDGQPPPAFQPFTPLTVTEVGDYQNGYYQNVTYRDAGAYWYRVGLWDRSQGRPLRRVFADLPPPPFNEQNQGPPPEFNQQPGQSQPGPPLASPFPYIELLATEFGVKVPYDVAAVVGQLAQSAPGLIPILLGVGAQFRFLGDAPGDQREGYRLSGPNGPLARKVARDVAQGRYKPDPTAYLMPAWVGTRLRDGRIKLLGRGELQSLGLYDQLLDLYPLPGWQP